MMVFMQMLMIPTPKGSTSRSSTRIRRVFDASNLFWGHPKIENPKVLRIEFWTSEIDVKKLSKRPRDPHNRIRLEKLCPKVVSDRKMAGRMPSKRRLRDFRPMIEKSGRNVNVPTWLSSFGDVWQDVSARLANDNPRRVPPCLAEAKPGGSLSHDVEFDAPMSFWLRCSLSLGRLSLILAESRKYHRGHEICPKQRAARRVALYFVHF